MKNETDNAKDNNSAASAAQFFCGCIRFSAPTDNSKTLLFYWRNYLCLDYLTFLPNKGQQNYNKRKQEARS